MNALMWSGGWDSTLLLMLLIEQKVEFDILQFRYGWTKAQKAYPDELIKQWNLRVYDFVPSQTVFVGKDEHLSLITEYHGIPVVRDVIEGDQCPHDLARDVSIPMKWSTYFVGTRADDRHPLVPHRSNGPEFEMAGAIFKAPLWNWTREDVFRELRARGIEPEERHDTTDTGNIALCTRCLNGTGQVYCPKENGYIPAIEWDRELNLRTYLGTGA